MFSSASILSVPLDPLSILSIHLDVSGSGPGGAVKLTYEAQIKDPKKMTGTMTRNVNGESTPGKWTAVKTK